MNELDLIDYTKSTSLSPSFKFDLPNTKNLTPKTRKTKLERSFGETKIQDSTTLVQDKTSPLLDKNIRLQLKMKEDSHTPSSSCLNDSSFLALSNCHISAPDLTQNPYGFKSSPPFSTIKRNQNQNLTYFSCEVFADSRLDKLSDPKFDSVLAIVYSIRIYKAHVYEVSGVLYFNSLSHSSSSVMKILGNLTGIKPADFHIVATEVLLLDKLADIFKRYDPDILVGYETQIASFGYLCSRCQAISYNSAPLLSRIPNARISFVNTHEIGHYLSGYGLSTPGRLLLSTWRLARKNFSNLHSYSFQNVVYHVMHLRIPFYEQKTLKLWWRSGVKMHSHILNYFLQQSRFNLHLLDKMDVIPRSSEFARLYGIELSAVLDRGSQYQVEGMMLRLLKFFNYAPISPSVSQRKRMSSPTALPLVMEPEAGFYTDPVVLLDFQSLYPSIIIAYNYCYSTCLGYAKKILTRESSEPMKFGCTHLQQSHEVLKKNLNNVNISPIGVVFLDRSVRAGILPLMLDEVLRSRVMVKNSLKKLYKDKCLGEDVRAICKVLEARQLGLKLISNVTYGYTSANFSGRMPCVEIADSIVSKARETLEDAISFVNNNAKSYGGRVIYGDTDSLFVLLKGKSRGEAFSIGERIAHDVTQRFPFPIKLKFEKVYQPLVLQTKKHYVGFMYESCDQVEPVYDAKGIETVRRDFCAAVPKILEKSIRIFFQSLNIDLVKSFVQKEMKKIIQNKVVLRDYFIAKEYGGQKRYKNKSAVPALHIANRLILKDPRSEPRMQERVAYVVIEGLPSIPLIKLVRSPQEFMSDSSLKINTSYYIHKQIIPPLKRVFGLVDVDVDRWFFEVSNIKKKSWLDCFPSSSSLSSYSNKKVNMVPTSSRRISSYFTSGACVFCGMSTSSFICSHCSADSATTYLSLQTLVSAYENKISCINKLCQTCSNSNLLEPKCASIDCPIFFDFNVTNQKLARVSTLKNKFNNLVSGKLSK